jgi:hypothetical protein
MLPPRKAGCNWATHASTTSSGEFAIRGFDDIVRLYEVRRPE